MFEATDPGEPPKTDGSEVDPVTLPEDSALAKYFREQGIENVVVVGLATDYWYIPVTSLASRDVLLIHGVVCWRRQSLPFPPVSLHYSWRRR